MKRLIAFISVLMLASVVSGTAVSITIYGTNRSNANSNITCYGCNNSIYVNAWNTSYVKNITINSSNASGDVVSFNISNVTGYQVQELKANGTAISGYQAGANGMLNFSYNVTGNKTLLLSPAENKGGLNFTWAQFTRPIVYSANESNISVAKQPNGSYAVNLTVGLSNGITTVTVNRSYVKATVYQNTNNTPMFMSVTAYSSGSGTTGCNYKTGTTNPPTDVVGSQGEANADMQGFWVLPGHYFAAFQSAGTCTIGFWTVWQ